MNGLKRGEQFHKCLPLPLERYCTVSEFNPKEFSFSVLTQKTRKKNKTKIVDEVFAFDIETTAIPEIQQSVLYIWQFQIGTRITVFGRTWEDFNWFMMKFRNCIPKGAKAIVYVHNLSYEFQFLKGVYDFTGDEDIFPIDRRKILYCRMYNCIEFRCSYLQTNMNLKMFTNKMNVKHKKLDDYDYNIPRYSWDELTVQELRYCQNDVLGLVEAIKEEMKQDGDTLLTIPYTSTGYVRRDFKKALSDAGFFYKWADEFFPTPELYDVMRNAFRGGDTHGNRYYAERVISNVHSYDRSSSYPDVICNRPFPVTPFELTAITSIDRVKECKQKHNRAFLMRLRFSDGISLKNMYWGSPYLSRDKSQKIVNGDFYNGRILSADSLELCVTDIDYEIIEAEYNIGKVEVLECYKSTYGKLPQCMIDLTIEYYRRKTELKGDPAQKYLYDKSKAKLNAIYGMTAQNPVHIPIVYNPAEKELGYDTEKSIEELFREQRKGYWLPYQYGIWVTAWARYELYLGVRNVSMITNTDPNNFRDFVYCDTDSVKFFGDADFTEYNAEKIRNSTASGAFATDRKGKTHYMGVFEQEDDYTEFKHLGAKKYCGVIGGMLEVTIAGVNKKLGAKELTRKGGIDALENGFTFVDAGGLNAQYNDIPPVSEWTVDGHIIPITSNVYLYPSEYTLGETADFIRITQKSKKDLDLCFQKLYNELVQSNNLNTVTP